MLPDICQTVTIGIIAHKLSTIPKNIPNNVKRKLRDLQQTKNSIYL
jgi:hypothetical protein